MREVDDDDDNVMASLFFNIRNSNINSEQQFNELKDKLSKLGFSYDIGGYLYWADPKYVEEWYVWSDKYEDGEEYEAYESIELLLNSYGLKPTNFKESM